MFLKQVPSGLLALLTACICGMAEAQSLAAEASPSGHIQVLAASCATCHGQHGNSLGVIPSLAGMPVNQFVQQMQHFASGTSSATVMHHHAMGLRPDEVQQLAHYFAQFTPTRPRAAPR